MRVHGGGKRARPAVALHPELAFAGEVLGAQTRLTGELGRGKHQTGRGGLVFQFLGMDDAQFARQTHMFELRHGEHAGDKADADCGAEDRCDPAYERYACRTPPGDVEEDRFIGHVGCRLRRQVWQ